MLPIFKRLEFIKLFSFVFWLGFLQFQTGNAQNVIINSGIEYQNIRGFGGMNHTIWIPDLNEDTREKAFGNEPGQLGLSILRVHIDPNPDVWNLEIPTARLAKSKGAIVFASPWNPPSSLLDLQASYNRIPSSNYGAYVDHLNAFSTYMTGNGGDLYAISVQNEPDYGEEGGWTDWTSSEMVDFMKNHASRITKRVIAPESFQFIRSYSDPILEDSEARNNLDIMGGHIYGGGLFDYPLARQYEKEVWMTEHYTSSDQSANLWPIALGVGKEIHDCMYANFNAYVWWYIRRFYGLITDDGNISKRGYVFSHFSKFVRPGSVRIDVINNTNLSVSAFKSGGNITVVAINQTASPIELDLVVQGESVSAMSKITTSYNVNMVNEGQIELDNNRLLADVAPFSISTFTTNASRAGKAGNEFPIATITVEGSFIDADINGTEPITINATGSSDPDGTIENYSWSLNGEQVSFQDLDTIEVPIGTHELILTLTDDDGGRSMDTVILEIKADESIVESEFWFEAECTMVGSSWQVGNNVLASNGSFINVRPGIQSLEAPTADASDHLVFTFNIPQDGIYRLWGRVRVPSPDDDSFWVKMDDGEWILWNSITGGADWSWDDIHNSNAGGDAEIYNLTAGEHKVYITYREDGADLDKILVVNNSEVPIGLGGDDPSCTVSTEEINFNSDFTIFPNPTTSRISISSEKGFKTISVRDVSGKIVNLLQSSEYLFDTTLDLEVNPGIYFIELLGQGRAIKRLVVTE